MPWIFPFSSVFPVPASLELSTQLKHALIKGNAKWKCFLLCGWIPCYESLSGHATALFLVLWSLINVVGFKEQAEFPLWGFFQYNLIASAKMQWNLSGIICSSEMHDFFIWKIMVFSPLLFVTLFQSGLWASHSWGCLFFRETLRIFFFIFLIFFCYSLSYQTLHIH